MSHLHLQHCLFRGAPLRPPQHISHSVADVQGLATRIQPLRQQLLLPPVRPPDRRRTKGPEQRTCCSDRAVACSAAASAPAAIAAVPHAARTLLGHSTWGVWAALCCAGALGLWLEEQTSWGKAMSGALLATLAGLAISNLGVIPAESHVYAVVNSYLLPLAVPLLLLSADLRRVLGDTGRLLSAFCCGAAATVLGSLLAFRLLPLRSLGANGWKVAAALTARHIGGSVNFIAVSEVLQLGPAVRMAGLAADDLIVSLYFMSLYALARNVPPDPAAGSSGASSGASSSASSGAGSGDPGSAAAASPEAAAEAAAAYHLTHGQDDRRSPTVLDGALALALSAAICCAGTEMAKAIGYRGGGITIITLLSVAFATLAPRLAAPLAPAGEGLAGILMQLFFATVGASGSISTVLATAPALFLWSAIAVFSHLALCLGWERAFGFSRRDMALASNANVGGPTTAAGMAAAKGWRSSMVPALLVGIFGYATATFVGIGCASLFRRMQFA